MNIHSLQRKIHIVGFERFDRPPLPAAFASALLVYVT